MSIYTITKEFRFEAAHFLKGLPEGHQCARLHGHSYRVVVELGADELNDRGFVYDYGDLRPFGAYLDVTFDHQLLNEVLETETGKPVQSSAENLARYFYNWITSNALNWTEGHLLRAVRVSETAKTWAEYRL